MAKYALALLFVACAGKSAAPVAGNGPEAPNEKVLEYKGPLVVEFMPQHAVEVTGADVFVWGWVEDQCNAQMDGYGAASNVAREELMKFIDVAVQQLDLQFQAVGQESASSAESQAIMAKITQSVGDNLGKGERAYQKLEREGSKFERFFVRYRVPKSKMEDAFASGIGERPLKVEVVRRVMASFDPDEKK